MFFQSNIEIFYNLQKLLLTTCAYFSLKNQEMVKTAFFKNVTQKLNILPKKKVLVYSKKAKNSTFEHTNTFFGKMFYHFFCHIHVKCFCNYFFDFSKDKIHML